MTLSSIQIYTQNEPLHTLNINSNVNVLMKQNSLKPTPDIGPGVWRPPPHIMDTLHKLLCDPTLDHLISIYYIIDIISKTCK